MIEVVLVRGDDWCAMYINGRKVEENHSFNEDWIARHFVGTTIRSFSTREDYDHEFFPDRLEDF